MKFSFVFDSKRINRNLNERRWSEVFSPGEKKFSAQVAKGTFDGERSITNFGHVNRRWAIRWKTPDSTSPFEANGGSKNEENGHFEVVMRTTGIEADELTASESVLDVKVGSTRLKKNKTSKTITQRLDERIKVSKEARAQNEKKPPPPRGHRR